MAGDQTFSGGRYFSYKRPPGYADAEAAIANTSQLFIDIWSVSAQTGVAFKSLLTGWQDSINSELYSETMLGHTEPIKKTKSIERVVSISLDVVAADETEAANNMRNVALLAKMQYPTGDRIKTGAGRRLQVRPGGDPVFKIRFANFLHDGKSMHTNGASAKEIGQLGYISNLQYEWDLDSGFHGTAEKDVSYVYPQLIKLTFDFHPFHEESPGWSYQGKTDQTGPGAYGTIFNRIGLPYSYSSTAAGFDDYNSGTNDEERERSGRGLSNVTVNKVNQARVEGALQGDD